MRSKNLKKHSFLLLLFSLSLSLSMIFTTQLQKGLSKAAPREPKGLSSIQCHEEREREGERPSVRGELLLQASEREREE
jgi:hypothetical protein